MNARLHETALQNWLSGSTFSPLRFLSFCLFPPSCTRRSQLAAAVTTPGSAQPARGPVWTQQGIVLILRAGCFAGDSSGTMVVYWVFVTDCLGGAALHINAASSLTCSPRQQLHSIASHMHWMQLLYLNQDSAFHWPGKNMNVFRYRGESCSSCVLYMYTSV